MHFVALSNLLKSRIDVMRNWMIEKADFSQRNKKTAIAVTSDVDNLRKTENFRQGSRFSAKFSVFFLYGIRKIFFDF